MQADLAHLLAKTRHFLGADGQRGFRRHVAAGWAGAAGGQHQVTASHVTIPPPQINAGSSCAVTKRAITINAAMVPTLPLEYELVLSFILSSKARPYSL